MAKNDNIIEDEKASEDKAVKKTAKESTKDTSSKSAKKPAQKAEAKVSKEPKATSDKNASKTASKASVKETPAVKVADKNEATSAVTDSKATDKKGAKGKKPAGERMTVKARSGNPAKRGEVVSALKDAKKTTTPVKLSKFGLNPAWLIPTMVGLMVLGMLWVVIFYLTAQMGGYPIPAIQYWNLVIGFSFIIAGFFFATKWK